MKLSMFTVVIALLFVAEGAFAACANNQGASQVKGTDLATLLSGNTVCAIRSGDSWQEEHRGGPASGELWDYKLGSTDPIDPTKQVGTWTVSGNGAGTVVTYDYGDGGTYSFEVWDNGGDSYSFCDGGALEMDFTLTGIGSGC